MEKENRSLLNNTLDIDINEDMTDAHMLLLIENRVTELMSQNADLLFSYLYRLDIQESKIKEALAHEKDAPNLALSKLILERQKQRIASKKKYKQDPPIKGWEF